MFPAVRARELIGELIHRWLATVIFHAERENDNWCTVRSIGGDGGLLRDFGTPVDALHQLVVIDPIWSESTRNGYLRLLAHGTVSYLCLAMHNVYNVSISQVTVDHVHVDTLAERGYNLNCRIILVTWYMYMTLDMVLFDTFLCFACIEHMCMIYYVYPQVFESWFNIWNFCVFRFETFEYDRKTWKKM